MRESGDTSVLDEHCEKKKKILTYSVTKVVLILGET